MLESKAASSYISTISRLGSAIGKQSILLHGSSCVGDEPTKRILIFSLTLNMGSQVEKLKKGNKLKSEFSLQIKRHIKQRRDHLKLQLPWEKAQLIAENLRPLPERH